MAVVSEAFLACHGHPDWKSASVTTAIPDSKSLFQEASRRQVRLRPGISAPVDEKVAGRCKAMVVKAQALHVIVPESSASATRSRAAVLRKLAQERSIRASRGDKASAFCCRLASDLCV